jgi:hypothetical protein
LQRRIYVGLKKWQTYSDFSFFAVSGIAPALVQGIMAQQRKQHRANNLRDESIAQLHGDFASLNNLVDRRTKSILVKFDRHKNEQRKAA